MHNYNPPGTIDFKNSFGASRLANPSCQVCTTFFLSKNEIIGNIHGTAITITLCWILNMHNIGDQCQISLITCSASMICQFSWWEKYQPHQS